MEFSGMEKSFGFQGTFFDPKMVSSVTHQGAFQGQNPEGLKHLLFHLVFALRSSSLAAKEDVKRNEDYVRHLVNLINLTCQERDEARQLCQKLQEKLLRKGLKGDRPGLPSAKSDSPHRRSLNGDSVVTACDSVSRKRKHPSSESSPRQNLFDSVSSIKKPSKEKLADSASMEFGQNPYLLYADKCPPSSLPTQDLQPVQEFVRSSGDKFDSSNPVEQFEFHQNFTKHNNISTTPYSHLYSMQDIETQSNVHGSSSFPQNSVQPQSHPLMQSVLSSQASGCDDRYQKQEIANTQKPFRLKIKTNERKPRMESNATVKRIQSEAVQTNPSQYFQQQSCLATGNAKDEPMVNPLPIMNPVNQINLLSPTSLVSNSGTVPDNSQAKEVSYTANQLARGSLNSPLSHGVSMASIVTQLEGCMDPAPSMDMFHLPLPAEADPQVMLSSLPPKGKLLEAVMKAGPLLQTLLLAGPLPQWRHPPPPLESFEIPLVSLPFSTSADPLLSPPPIVNAPSKLAASFIPTCQNHISHVQTASHLTDAAFNDFGSTDCLF